MSVKDTGERKGKRMPRYAALISSQEQEDVAPVEMQQSIDDYMEFGQNAAEVIVG